MYVFKNVEEIIERLKRERRGSLLKAAATSGFVRKMSAKDREFQSGRADGLQLCIEYLTDYLSAVETFDVNS